MRRAVGATLLLAALVSAAAWLGRASVSPPPNAPAPEHPLRAAALNDEGLTRLGAGDLEGAVGRFREARALDPYNEVLGHNLSVGLARRAAAAEKDDLAAVALLDEALGIWPENPEALDLLSSLHYRAGRFEEALQLALRLKAIFPQRGDLRDYVRQLEVLVGEQAVLAVEAGQFFTLRYSGSRRLEFEGELVSGLQREMDSLGSSLGIFPEEPIDILLLTEDLGDRAVPPQVGMGGLYDGRIRLYLGQGLPSEEDLRRTVRHELVHALLHRGGGQIPVWFHEGLAQLLGEVPGAADLDLSAQALQAAARDGWRPDLEALSSSFLGLPERERALSYAYSLLFVRYLVDRFGKNLVPTLLADLSRGVPFEAALGGLTGRDLEGLQADFAASSAGRG